MDKYYLKIHSSNSKTIVAVCDAELLGKEFREGNLVLRIDEPFYGGKLVDIDEVVQAISSADIVVVTGARLVEELSKRGIVPSSFALKVQGQPHIQIVKEVERY
ncbi:MAG: DUF424 family protein [Crenarchaeota archaeon]|nr:DUF424 family protein [Thermoproteota archaeon]